MLAISEFRPKIYNDQRFWAKKLPTRLTVSLTHLRGKAFFVGHLQTVQNQIRRRKMRRLIRFSTVSGFIRVREMSGKF